MKKTVLGVLAFLILCASQALAMGDPPIGKAAPEFSFKAIDGKTYSLSALKNKLVVLEWTNPDCPFVHKNYDSGNMQSLQRKYTALGVVWFSVNSSAKGKEGYFSDNAQAKDWEKKQKASPTTLIRDPDGVLGQLYGAKATPHMFVIDAKGLLSYKGAIDDIPSADPADIPKAKNLVAAALDALLAGKPVAIPETKAYGCSVKYKD